MANPGVGETSCVNELIDGASRPARRRLSGVAGAIFRLFRITSAHDLQNG
jgi:hypothetical protein